MANLDFSDLLQSAEQLTSEFDPLTTVSDLPRVERNLHQLVEVGQQLFAKASRNAGAQDVRASILLGSKGIDLPAISQKLSNLTSISASFEPIEPLRDTDVAGFLKNERENALLSVIEETRKETFESVERRIWEASAAEWEKEKGRFLTSLGDEGMVDLSQTVILRPEISHIHDSTLGTKSALDSVELIFADQVCSYNEAVSKGGPKPDLFEKFVVLFPETSDSEVAILWEISNEIRKSLPCRAQDPVKARASLSTNKAIISSARKYLENSFVKFVRNTVFSNLHNAQLGGVPGTYNLIKSFINIRIAPDTPALEDGLVDGVPVWPFVYYCLRCGDLKAAMQVLQKAGAGLAEVYHLLDEICSSDGRLSTNTEHAFRVSYRRCVQTTTDPFKRAVHCILAACDPNDEHSEVATSIDDYLWIKLTQIREEELLPGGGNDVLTLSQLQHLLSEDYGESHFNAFEQPILYFQVLFLTGQVEAAIDFLFRCDRFRSHGVHIALAMFEAGLLLLPSNSNSPLLTNALPSGSTTVKQLNVARLVLLYVRKFESTDPKEALHYFYFLRKLTGQNAANLFASCVSELVLESRQFDLLLGHVQPDGVRTPGLIDKFNGQGFDASYIIEMVANDSEEKGMFEDSVKLHDLAGNHEKVVELLNKLLAQVVSQQSLPESRRDRLQRLAISIAKRYRNDGHSATRESSATFYLLLDMMTFFDLTNVKKYEEALEIATKIKIIPFSQAEVDVMVSTFRVLADEVRRNIPDILLACMNILVNQYKQGKSSTPSRVFGQDGGHQKYLDGLREKAKALITFAGMIPYRMPGDMSAKLVHLEVLMN